MNSSFWFDTISLGWFIVHTKGSLVRIPKLGCISVHDNFFFILANSPDPDEKLYYGILSGSSLFAKVPIRGFQYT